MSVEQDMLDRRASVIVRDLSQEDSDDYDDDYELESLDGTVTNRNVPPNIIVTDSDPSGVKQKIIYGRNSDSISSNNTQVVNPFSNRNALQHSDTGDHTNIYKTVEEGTVDDYSDYYSNNKRKKMNKKNKKNKDDANNGPLYRVLPRTLPDVDFFTVSATDKNFTNMTQLSGSHRYVKNYNRMSDSFPVRDSKVENDNSTNYRRKSSNTYHNGNNLSLSEPHKINTNVSYSTDNNSSIKVGPQMNDYFYLLEQDLHRLVVRPPVNSQDQLLAEIGALYKVKNKVANMNIYDSFPQGTGEKLRDLRQSHVRIIQLLREREAKAEEQRRRAIQASNSNNLTLRTLNSSMINDRFLDITNTMLTHSISTPRDRKSTALLAKSVSLGNFRRRNKKTAKEKPLPSLMSNPETKKYVNLLIDTIKEL